MLRVFRDLRFFSRVSAAPGAPLPGHCSSMAVNGFQKLTVAAVVVLCAALILPKMFLRRDTSEDQAPGRFPPMKHRHVTSNPGGQRSAAVRGHGEVRGAGSGGLGTGSGGAGTGSGPGGKSNLAAQIIPVYGFGILLYILYILFKITSKGSKPAQSRFQSLRSENEKRKISDFELSQLQQRLMETELVMETLVNTTAVDHHSSPCVSVDQEQSLLQQLTAITQAMKNNQMVQDFTAAEEKDEWDQTDFSEDFDPFWSHYDCNCDEGEEKNQTEQAEERRRTEEEMSYDGEKNQTETSAEEKNLTATSAEEKNLTATSAEEKNLTATSAEEKNLTATSAEEKNLTNLTGTSAEEKNLTNLTATSAEEKNLTGTSAGGEEDRETSAEAEMDREKGEEEQNAAFDLSLDEREGTSHPNVRDKTVETLTEANLMTAVGENCGETSETIRAGKGDLQTAEERTKGTHKNVPQTGQRTGEKQEEKRTEQTNVRRRNRRRRGRRE